MGQKLAYQNQSYFFIINLFEENYILCIYKSRLGFTLFHISGGLDSKRQNIFISTLSPRYQNLEYHSVLHDPLEMKQSRAFEGNQTIAWILPSRALNNWSLKEFYPNYQADSFLM